MADNIEPTLEPDVAADSVVGEALGLIVVSEELAAERYRALAATVDPQVRPALLTLYAAAKQNADELRGAARARQAKLTQQQVLELQRCTDRLRRAVLNSDFGSKPVEDDVLDYVENCEHLTFAYYCCLSSLLSAGPLKDLFRRLMDQKRRHEEAIHQCCDALFLIW
ncbi:hypothetical protein [Halochromatium glycolicum]|uniref:Uncharacterized protein n=1 Tax=Halochromatium glycolicum TaxID=85075 RepID=A0AAJ0XBW4_9GAMM|nr:hypothetical protein [Halochromatium glycolicum]MBK1707181.1 hypothetical protein [Halochromatium glycolicum]